MNHTCTAGFARLDITPPLGVRIGGYYEVRVGAGVADPLYVNAVAFGQGDQTAVLLVCDLLGIVYNDAASRWPLEIADQIGLPRDAVFMCHTHTHTGPVVVGGREPSDPQYDAWLFRRLCDAARLAIKDLTPVIDVQMAEDDVPGFSFVRRFKIKGGYYKTWGGEGIEAPACDGDDSLRLIRILRENAKEIALVNYQLHPDCMGGTAYSADYPGAFRDTVEQARPDVHCVYLDGAEGQMVATDWINHTSPTVRGHARAVIIGTGLAKGMLHLFDKTVSTGHLGLSFAQQPVNAKTKRDSSRIPEADRIIALHEANRDEELDCPAWLRVPIVAESYVLRQLENENLDYIPMRVSAIVFCGMALLGIPGEPFNEIGKAIRANSIHPVTCVCCQTNGCFGYYPPEEAFDQGGYEPRNTRLARGTAEQLTQISIDLLNNL